MELKSFVRKIVVGKVGKGAATKQLQLYQQVARWVVRLIQFVLTLIVLGLYANRLDNDRKAGAAQHPAWIFAVFVAGVSCCACLFYCIPLLATHKMFYFDLGAFFLWITTFGIFANIFLKPDVRKEKTFQGTSVTAMTHAVWLDLAIALFWLFTGIYGAVRTIAGRKISRKVDNQLDSLESKVKGKVRDGFSAQLDSRFPGDNRVKEMARKEFNARVDGSHFSQPKYSRQEFV